MVIIPGYIIKEIMEENSFLLYKAKREKDSLNVLIKSTLTKNTKEAEQLKHEFDLAEILDPSYVLKPVTLERSADTIAVVYEDFNGIFLNQYLNNQPLKLKQFLELAIAISSSISKLHEKGIIHKDINPHNILINPDTGEIKIINFGLASLIPSEYSTYSKPIDNSPLIEANLPYISPEQTGRMNRTLDYHTDMYSLGVTFYLMITGQLPFTANDPIEWIYNHLVRIPKPPIQISSSIPQVVSDIIIKLLSKLAEDRYQSMNGLVNDLSQCISLLDETGSIHPFPLGKKDFSGKLSISQKIYGRDKEIKSLLEIYNIIVNTGIPQLILISGYSGVGKTALVNELNKPIIKEKGYFITGKFDQFKRNVPYFTIVDAFKELVSNILSQPEEKIKEWRYKILQAVGINGQVIIDVIPKIELVIGKQPSVVPLSSAKSQNRFNLVFEKFIGVFSKKEHPLTIFLDDLQWADTASLKLIERITINQDNEYILLIGAYRDNEVYPAHPLMLTLDKIKSTKSIVKEIKLYPIKEADIINFISDTLRSDPNTIYPLAHLVYEKTGGNPFFSIQFLIALREDNLLKFSNESFQWYWELQEIKAREYTDNVAEFLTQKIKRLKTGTQNILTIAACIGNSFEKKIIEGVVSESEHEVALKLNESINEGLLYSFDGTCKFLHDRVRESVYAMISDQFRPSIHLQIGRFLLSHYSKNLQEENIFDIADQFNQGIDLIAEPKDKALVFNLNFRAGKKAKNTYADISGQMYLSQAMELLPPNSWESKYEETFELYIELSECEYLIGNLERADILFNLILEHAQSNLDKSKVYKLRSKLYQVTGRYDNAVMVLLKALRLFNVNFPEVQVEFPKAVENELQEISFHMKGKNIEDLYNLPNVTDPIVVETIDLLVDANTCTYTARPEMYPWFGLKAVNISLQYGITRNSCYAFMFYASYLVGKFGAVSTGWEFSKIALRLNEKFNDLRLRGTLLAFQALSINFRRQHLSKNRPVLEEAFEACLNVGDLPFASYSGIFLVWQLISEGMKLDEVLLASEKYVAFARKIKNEVMYQVIRQFQQFIKSIKGLTKNEISFDDPFFSELECFKFIELADYGPGIAFHHIMKEMVAFIYNRYDDAYTFAIESEKVLQKIVNLITWHTHHFYHALTLTALFENQSVEKQQEFTKILNEKLILLRQWSNDCPENFYNCYALVLAEIARIENRIEDAMGLYEDAIRSAKENGFVQNEAIANELAGMFYKNRGYDKIANTYLSDAYSCYARWGAHGKTKQIEELYPAIRGMVPSSTGLSVQQLDLSSIIKAHQTISSQIELKNVTSNMMHIVMEQAAAEKSVLLLIDNEQLVVATEAEIIQNKINIKVTDKMQVPEADMLSESIVQYVKRTKEKVIIEDASITGMFSNDEYLRSNHPKSIACLPIIKQSVLTGILYLENNLYTGAFSEDKVAILELLASQAAISIENARLFRDLNVSKQQLQDIMDNSSAVIFIKDLEGKYIFINRHCEILFNLSREKVVGRTDYGLLPKEFADTITVNDKQVLETSSPITFEEIVPQKDGYHTYIAVKFPLRDPSGKPYAVCGISTDITERKQTEEQIRQLNLDLEQTNRELIKTNTDLDNFVYTASHNLRGPVTSIEGLINILDLGLFKEDEFKDILGMMKTSVSNFKNAVNDLTEISRIQNMIPKENMILIDMKEAIEEVLSDLTGMIEESGAEIKVNLSGTKTVFFSNELFKRIIFNLITNSIKFRSADRKLQITITTVQTHKFIILCIYDNGTGISKVNQEKIFSMFKKAHEYTKGSGIGLYIVKRIIENAGGKIELESKVNIGTVFKLYFKKDFI